jgi:hypothetical protein
MMSFKSFEERLLLGHNDPFDFHPQPFNTNVVNRAVFHQRFHALDELDYSYLPQMYELRASPHS